MSQQHYQQANNKGGIRNSIWLNLLLIVAVCILLFLLFFGSLGFITNHGDQTKVPKMVGKSVAEAVSTLEGLGFEVKVDSTYEPTHKPFTVLVQMPEAGETVKTGRTLFLTVNKLNPPETPMPKLTDLAYRSAVLILQSNRLVVGDTIHKPYIGKDIVMDQLYNGQPIRPGTLVPQGSRISLVVGDGLSNQDIPVPDLIGMSYQEAVVMLSGNNMLITPVFEGAITDSAGARVYNQSPSAMSDLGTPSRIHEGDNIDIFIMQNPSDSLMDHYRNLWRENMKVTVDSSQH